MKTNKKGISLIVLVITILVMIILAAAVLLYLDDSKIIKHAKRAVTASDVSVAKEVVTVARAEWRANQEKVKKEGYNSFKEYAQKKLEDAGFEIGTNGGQVEVTENGLVYAYVIPVIPAGYVASSVDTEDEVEEGLVIYQGTEAVTADNVDTAKKTRNQFVWVPVPNMTEFVREIWGDDRNEDNWVTKIWDEILSYRLEDTKQGAEYEEMRASVAKYGGFYIGRYEAGNKNGSFVVRSHVKPMWWGYSERVIERELPLCATLSTDSVVGHLVYGEEWDAALRFIAIKDEKYPNTGKYNNKLSGNIGAEAESDFIETGSNDMYSRNNIYDMAGNVLERTMEFLPSYGYYHRGALFAGDRERYVGTGFRPALYLK